MKPNRKMKQIQVVLGLLLILLLASCGQGTPTRTATASAAAVQGCYLDWASRPLSDLSARIQKSFDSSGLKSVTVHAQAYGENCYDNNTHQVIAFTSLETDIRVTAQVKSIRDTDDLGRLLEQILPILEGLPAQSLSAGHLGNIGITYQAGAASLNLSFTDQDARAARERGLHGAALITALLKK